MFEAIL